MAADTPVAMIENASLPGQRECASTVAAMAGDADAFRLRSPAVLVIGQVAACRMYANTPALADAGMRRSA
jgi:uroporphyrin-III C-methyltransferase